MSPMLDDDLDSRVQNARAKRRPRHIWQLAVTATMLSFISPGAWAQDASQAQHLPSIRLQAGLHNIDAELARTPQEREIGLMFRSQLGDHAGMLFAFEEPVVQCFWMHNTLIPLTAAFIGDDGSIVNLVDMAPQTDSSHCSSRPVRYVLEMAKGWFTKAGLKAGSRLSGAPFVRTD